MCDTVSASNEPELKWEHEYVTEEEGHFRGLEAANASGDMETVQYHRTWLKMRFKDDGLLNRAVELRRELQKQRDKVLELQKELQAQLAARR